MKSTAKKSQTITLTPVGVVRNDIKRPSLNAVRSRKYEAPARSPARAGNGQHGKNHNRGNHDTSALKHNKRLKPSAVRAGE